VRGTAAQVKLVLAIGAAEHLDQLFVDNREHLLSRRKTSHHIGADSLLPDALHKLPGHSEIDIRFDQCDAHFAQRRVDIFLSQLPLSTKIAEYSFETLR